MSQKKHVVYRTGFLLFTLLLFFSFNASAQEILTLQSAMQTALENSPEVRQSELDLIRSSEMLKAQEAMLKSNFSLRFNPITYNRTQSFNEYFSTWYTNETTTSNGMFTISQPIIQTDGTLSLNNGLTWRNSHSEATDVTTKTFQNRLYISYDQPLYTYNRTELELEELELDMENTQYSYEIQKLNIEQQVTQSFYDVYQTKTALEIAREEHENQLQSYEIIRNKVEAGLSAEEELFQAELNRAQSELSVQNAQESLDNIYDSFKILIGKSIFEDIEVETDITHRVVEVDIEKALNSGLINRMELRQREINIITAMNSLTRTAALNEFRGNLNLQYGITGNDEDVMTMYDKPVQEQTVSVTFDIPLWDWGEKEARIKASEAQVQRQELSLEDLRNNIIQAIRRAYRNLEKLVKQIDIAEQNVDNAQLTYDINLERYKNGDLTSMDLQLFQTQLSEVKMNLVQALINYKLALLDMKILSLWDFENNNAVLQDLVPE